jgi:hypothetical protein
MSIVLSIDELIIELPKISLKLDTESLEELLELDDERLELDEELLKEVPELDDELLSGMQKLINKGNSFPSIFFNTFSNGIPVFLEKTISSKRSIAVFIIVGCQWSYFFLDSFLLLVKNDKFIGLLYMINRNINAMLGGR